MTHKVQTYSAVQNEYRQYILLNIQVWVQYLCGADTLPTWSANPKLMCVPHTFIQCIQSSSAKPLTHTTCIILYYAFYENIHTVQIIMCQKTSIVCKIILCKHPYNCTKSFIMWSHPYCAKSFCENINTVQIHPENTHTVQNHPFIVHQIHSFVYDVLLTTHATYCNVTSTIKHSMKTMP